MGMMLSCPLVASSSPLSRKIENIWRMQEAGAGAVVLWSLFEEQIEHEAAELEHYLHYGADRFAESLTYFPQPAEYHSSAEEYLEHITKAKEAVDVPIIASLNGTSARGWTSYARKMQEAGADAIELNVYSLPADAKLTASKVESMYLSVLRAVKAGVDIPVAMKLSPYFSSLTNLARRLVRAGAKALVLFNRFYQPDLDIHALEVRPDLVLSTSAETRLPMRWIAVLSGRVNASLAATSGVHTGEDAAKMIMAGADVVMMASALLQNGIDHLRTVRRELEGIMESKGYESVKQMKGVLSQSKCPEPAAFERANYIRTLNGFGPTATLE
jgi:dihydroorotate dehydrogenase (fumarate)